MPRIEPIELYTKAVLYHGQAEYDKSAECLSQARGAHQVSPIIRAQIGDLLAPGTIANEAVLGVIATEVTKKGDSNE